MADFATSTTTKTAIRPLTEPLADVTAFDNLVQGVIASNPFQCVTYNAKGVNHAPVERSRQTYTVRILYQDNEANVIGMITVRTPTIAAFTAIASHILADTTIVSAMGGIPARDMENEKYTTTLKCHDQNGEIYFVDFSRDQIRLSSFSSDEIQSRVETWADTVPELN